MNNNLKFYEMLDFSDTDLTAPDVVVDQIIQELPKLTQNIIYGQITAYDGPVTSYTETTTSLATLMSTGITEKHIDIQKELGKHGEKTKKYECFLYTSNYKNYKYRMFFMKYDDAHYPVQFTLEESIARSIQSSSSYIITCNNRKEVEDLILRILYSQKVLNVMQELIRIHQSNKTIDNI